MIYEFGAFRLDSVRRQLLLKDANRALPLTSRAFETLLFFVEHRGELLNKGTLMEAIWPNIAVEENNLNQNISILRRVLGETPGEHRFIVTVPGRGYRFVASVTILNGAAEPDLGVQRPPPPSAARGGALSRTSVAVLPFLNLTGDPAKEYLGDSIAEELINTLTRAPGWFRVPSRSSTFAYKGRSVDARQIARELEVGAVLEGSVRSAGDRIRIAVQLVDGRTGHHLWSQSYEHALEHVFALQDELSVSIADALTVGGPARTSAARSPPTRDLEAYHLFLQAKSLNSQPTEHNLRTALQLLERALERDPSFARAWQGMAVLRGYYLIALDYPMPDALMLAESDARRALALEPSLSASHGTLGFIDACRGNWIEAETEFAIALASITDDPEIHLVHAVYVAQSVGHVSRAADEVESACRLTPLAPLYALNVAAQKILAGDYAEALQWIELAIANGVPRGIGLVLDMLAHVAEHQGRHADAMRCMNDGLSPALRAAGGTAAVKAFFAASADPSCTANALVELQSWETNLRTEDFDLRTAQRLMRWYTVLGAVDAAYSVGVRALDRAAAGGTVGMAWGMLWTPEMRNFRRDARFQSFVERLGFIKYWEQYGPPDGCELRDGLLTCP
jgi:TolB-like protein/Tfp pilus assembly protein PilF